MRRLRDDDVLTRAMLTLPVFALTFAALLAPADTTDCAMVQVLVQPSDAIAASVPRPRCGGIRLVLLDAHRPPETDSLNPSHLVEISVALINDSPVAVRTPIEMRIDSISPMQYGRQIEAYFIRDYVEVVFWDGRSLQQPWSFVSSGPDSATLRPGKRTRARSIKLLVHPLSQGFRLWFGIRGVKSTLPDYVGEQSARSVPPDTGALGADVDRFIRSARLPKIRKKVADFRYPQRGLLLFSVSYGEPQDCPSGCVYSQAVGLKYGGQIGWLRVDDYEQPHVLRDPQEGGAFPLASRDAYLFSVEFIDTLAAATGPYGAIVRHVVLPALFRHPNAPQAFLLRYARPLYAHFDAEIAYMIVSAPASKNDAEVLTLLAALPNGAKPYENARISARTALHALAPSLIGDQRTPARTLFLLAQTLEVWRDSALVIALARHPNVRRNVATLTVLSDIVPFLGDTMLTAVRAPTSVRRDLWDYLSVPDQWLGRRSKGQKLLDDPVTGANRDVLLVLANTVLPHGQEVVWAASRRLPEEAYGRWKFEYKPIQ